MEQAHKAAGGKKDIAVYLCANTNVLPFYEKLGMVRLDDEMEYNRIEGASFKVE